VSAGTHCPQKRACRKKGERAGRQNREPEGGEGGREERRGSTGVLWCLFPLPSSLPPTPPCLPPSLPHQSLSIILVCSATGLPCRAHTYTEKLASLPPALPPSLPSSLPPSPVPLDHSCLFRYGFALPRPHILKSIEGVEPARGGREGGREGG